MKLEPRSIMSVEDVMCELQVSISKAYGIIRRLNQELESKGFLTVRGKVSRLYFMERFYGMSGDE